MAKKIAFGTTLLNRGMDEGGIDGIGHYCQELLYQLENNNDAYDIQRFSFGQPDSSREISLYPNYPAHLLQGFLGLESRSKSTKDALHSADLIHSTDHLIPVGIKKPLLASVMDVIPLSHPEFIKSKFAPVKALLWEKLSRRADHIITISEFSKQEIAKWMDYPAEQITTIPLGIDKRYFETVPENDIRDIQRKFGIDRPFFLFIGSLQPRKNLVKIIEAHKNLPGNQSKEFPLIVVGREFWDDGAIKNALEQAINEKRCSWLKYVTEWEKRCLLQSALALCFTSLYEGFGLPILEAFASRTPVITSNVTSMPEIAGNCAILVNPMNADEITQAFSLIAIDESKRKTLIQAGLDRAKIYSWENAAAKTSSIYQILT